MKNVSSFSNHPVHGVKSCKERNHDPVHFQLLVTHESYITDFDESNIEWIIRSGDSYLLDNQGLY